MSSRIMALLAAAWYVQSTVACSPEVGQETAASSASLTAIESNLVSLAATNLLQNGSFESGLSPFVLILSNGARASESRDSSSATDGRYSEKISISRAVAGSAWSVMLRYPNLPISAGQTVIVAFDAKASTARNIEVGVQQLASPYKWYSINYFAVGTGFSRYSFTFKMPTGSSSAGLNFDIGDKTGSVSLDNIVVSTASTTPTPTPTPIPTPTPAPTPDPSAAMSPPAGFTTAQMIFEDRFTSASLDTSKWNPWLGDDRYARWNDQGKLPSPYSGVNCDSTCSTTFQNMYYDPYPYGYGTNTTGNHLVGGNGNLSLIASPSNLFSNLGFQWAAASVTTYGKAYIPASGGYAQFRARMPDSRYGAWAGIWLLSSQGAEIDIQESGYLHGSAPVNNVLASHWQGSGGTQIKQDTGMDLSAAYHVYGVDYRPGQSIKIYLDGRLMASWTSNIPTNAAYQLLLDFEIAHAPAAGWHTLADPANHPGPFYFDVNDVQIYKLP